MDLDQDRPTWRTSPAVLHLGLFPAFLLFVIRLRRWQGKQRFFKDSDPSHWLQLLRYSPVWVIPAAAVLFAFDGPVQINPFFGAKMRSVS
jgi:hypothetical protein